MADLAHRVTQEATTPFERVLAIHQHLLENYRYSLESETATLSHPLEEFLFTRKTGYCEHYATAMVVMLRTIGIPARLVTGFLATEWNEYGGYFTVRQRDAHAWVEVYFPLRVDHHGSHPRHRTLVATNRWDPFAASGNPFDYSGTVCSCVIARRINWLSFMECAKVVMPCANKRATGVVDYCPHR